MKLFMLSALQQLKDFGFDVILFIAGIAGGIVFLTKSPKLSIGKQILTVISGGLTANYVTPLAAEWMNLSDKTLYGIAFLLGYGGMKTVEILLSYLQGKFRVAEVSQDKSNTENNG